MKKILIGGSPCTSWAICNQRNREITAEGTGWELFRNYLIAKEKFQPDFFLYENNESASEAIKSQISAELGRPLTHINSALVSAQHRKRIYCTNVNVPQPADRGIVLKDVLETDGVVDREKAYCIKQHPGTAIDYITRHQNQVAFTPVRIGTIENAAKNQAFDSQQYRVYSPEGKSATICGRGGGVGAKTGLYATPVGLKFLSENEMRYMVRETHDGRNHFDYGYIHSDTKDKSQCVLANLHKGVPYNVISQRIEWINLDNFKDVHVEEDGTVIADSITIYSVVGGKIGFKGDKYHINLPDGYYIIRKLTPVECERLQTLPDNYTALGLRDGKVIKESNCQRYSQVGNGWTAEVIMHIMRQWNIPLDEELQVLSLYDGIATGMYCLNKLGYTNVTYKAYEIDKYAMEVAKYNWPDIVECGDAFAVRENNWRY